MAAHLAAEGHEMPLSALPDVPFGLGVEPINQLAPFHASARVTGVPALLWYEPTAVHAVAELHERPPRELLSAPAGLAVERIDQPFPFHTSARLNVVPAVLKPDPTAAHAWGELHEMLLRSLNTAPAGSRVGWIDQLFPFHSSASVPPPYAYPTAVHTVSELQDTPSSWLGVDPFGSGVVSIDQLVPFHASARVREVPTLTS
jgi:hypothetical protein